MYICTWYGLSTLVYNKYKSSADWAVRCKLPETADLMQLTMQ